MSYWFKFRKAPIRVVKIAHKKHRIKLKRSMLKLQWVLAQEKVETKQMMHVYRRYTQGSASKEEIRQANEQFVDILKGLGLGVVAILPFAPITIPVAIKVGKYVGVEILPSSFATLAQLDKNEVCEKIKTKPSLVRNAVSGNTYTSNQVTPKPLSSLELDELNIHKKT